MHPAIHVQMFATATAYLRDSSVVGSQACLAPVTRFVWTIPGMLVTPTTVALIARASAVTVTIPSVHPVHVVQHLGSGNVQMAKYQRLTAP